MEGIKIGEEIARVEYKLSTCLKESSGQIIRNC